MRRTSLQRNRWLWAAGPGVLVLSFAFMVLSASCATAVAPRAAAPLVPGTVAVGAAGVVAAGNAQDGDSWQGFLVAGGGASVAAPVLVRDRVQLDVDVDVAGGLRLTERQWFVGAGSGARGWYTLDDAGVWRVGLDVAISAYSQVGEHVVHSSPYLLGELRPLLAWEVTDDVWLGTRPGVVVPWARGTEIVPFLDVPLSLTVQARGVRAGVEAGVQGPYFLPLGAARAGAFVAVLF